MPDDPFYEDINPYLKVWLYESWVHEMELEAQKLKNQAIFIGSFFNPEMAQKMIKDEHPDYSTTDLDDTSKLVREKIMEEEQNKKKRKKRKKRKVIE